MTVPIFHGKLTSVLCPLCVHVLSRYACLASSGFVIGSAGTLPPGISTVCEVYIGVTVGEPQSDCFEVSL